MEARIAVLPGDGIGKEIVAEAVKVLLAVGERYGHQFHCQEALVGGVAIDATGTALPEETLALCRESDAILFGAVGDPRYDGPRVTVRPEQGMFGLRKGFDLFANLRPVKLYPALQSVSPIREDIVAGVDMVIVRELTGGLYFGKPRKLWETSRGRRAVDTLAYSEREIVRILRAAFELARTRRKKVTSVDKQNVLATSRLWREVATEVGQEYPDVELEHMLVDTCAMRLIRRPRDFDVIVTENTFGDILTDEASMLAGSMGMLPSASLGQGKFGLYEPIHGSAPRYAGQNTANPIATILSVGMMLHYSFDLPTEAQAVEKAVERVLEKGYRTRDIMGDSTTLVGTKEMGELIAAQVKEI